MFPLVSFASYHHTATLGHNALRAEFSYTEIMVHVVALALTLVWIAANFYLWSIKQNQVLLFWQSMGMAAIAYPALFWYVRRSGK